MQARFSRCHVPSRRRIAHAVRRKRVEDVVLHLLFMMVGHVDVFVLGPCGCM